MPIVGSYARHKVVHVNCDPWRKDMRVVLGCLLTVFCTLGASAQNTVADGVKLIENKEYDKARATFEAVLKLDPKNSEAHFKLGGILLTHYRDLDGAVDHLEESVKINDQNAEYHWMLGNAYGLKAREANIFSQLSLAGSTKEHYLKAATLDPREVRYRVSIMNYYLRAPGIAGGSVSKARDEATEVLRLDPYQGHLALAQIAAHENEFSEAEREYKKAIEAGPKNWRPYHLLGYLYLQLKRYDDAIAQFQKYVALAPGDANSHDSLGDGYLAKENVDAAIAQYAKALDINPRFSTSLYNLGQCYERKNMKNEALQSYRRYLAVDPQGINADKAEDRIEELSK